MTSTLTSTSILKTNDNREFKGVVLPLPPSLERGAAEMEVYARFMRHLRMVPNSQAEIKVLSAIQFTADMLDIRDALVSKILVDCGLRGVRKAFPSEYLDHVDASLMRSGWEVGGPTAAAIELKKYWDKVGEDTLAAYRREPTVAQESLFVE